MDPSATGVSFVNRLSDWASAENRVLNNGSGVAAGDFDRDGLVDLLFMGLQEPPRLYRNLGGWHFQDVTAPTGLLLPLGFYRGAVFADLNGDGWLDVIAGSLNQGVLCYWNDGHGHFIDATAMSGLANPHGSSTFALADVDGNGTLDLYVTNYRRDDIRDWPRIPVMFVNGQPKIPPDLQDRLFFRDRQITEVGEPDQLFLNDGQGHFRAEPWTQGRFLDEQGHPLKSPPLDWGLTAAFRDLNQDGAPDLYVCNDYWTPDRLWLNTGDGHFKAAASITLRKTSASSMGVDFADINRDGYVDFFVVDMLSRHPSMRKRQAAGHRLIATTPGEIENRPQALQNTLFLNRGDNTFAEIAHLAGVQASEWSWAPVFLDVDLDGYDDLVISSGHVRDIQDLDANERVQSLQATWRRTARGRDPKKEFTEAKLQHNKLYPPLQSSLVAFHNRGNLGFEDQTTAWGFKQPGIHHGIALADLDNDGDLDLVVNCLGTPAKLYRNNSTQPRIAIRLHGKSPNTDAIGAQVELKQAHVAHQRHEISCGGGYLSGSDTLRVFAPGATREALTFEVRWRDGTTTEVRGIQSNHFYEVRQESTSRPRKSPSTRPPQTISLFEDITPQLAHTHQESVFNDFETQPLLPRKLSQAGPGLAWFDWDGDGWDDLLISSAPGRGPFLFKNEAGRSLKPQTLSLPPGTLLRGQSALLGHRDSQGTSLLAGLPRREAKSNDLSGVLVVTTNTQACTNLDLGSVSVGSLALGDLDADGDLDLFAAGQYTPGSYPSPSSSVLFRRDRETWSPDQENAELLRDVGLVQGAIWTDLNGDGFPELVLACEWGPIRVFLNERGKLKEVTAGWGLETHTGLWMGVTAGDFDGDGLMDLAAGNWGHNSSWAANPEHPLTLFYGDLASRGQMDLIETEIDPLNQQLRPRLQRQQLVASLPSLLELFPTHLRFSEANVDQLWAALPRPPAKKTVATLASSIFLNRGGRFERHDLPVEAQFAPCFGISVADFDGDGSEDLVLAQNLFAFRWEDQRLDAGRGLLLRGDNHGHFSSVPGQSSGLRVYGEQRAVAVCDFDHDGRVDLAVTQNGSQTKLFHNQGARPGCRVQLQGPPNNPSAIGASLRLKYANGFGPRRELHAGAGYWSQDSAVPVLGMSETPTAIEVSWPGGTTLSQPIEAPFTEVVVRCEK